MKNQQSTPAAAWMQGIAMSIIIGLQYFFIKQTVMAFRQEVLLFLAVRFIIACLPLVFFLKGFNWRVFFDRDVLFICLIQPVANVLAQTYAAMYTDVTIIAYLTALAPFTMFLAGKFFQKERANLPYILFMFLAILAACLAASNSASFENVTVIGISLTILSLLLRALYAVKTKDAVAYYYPVEIAAAQMAARAAVFTAAALISGQMRDTAAIWASMTLKDIIGIAYLSVLSLTAAYILNNRILDALTVMVSGLLNNLTFLAAFLSGVLLLGEKPGWQGIAGSILLIIAVAGAAKFKPASASN